MARRADARCCDAQWRWLRASRARAALTLSLHIAKPERVSAERAIQLVGRFYSVVRFSPPADTRMMEG